MLARLIVKIQRKNIGLIDKEFLQSHLDLMQYISPRNSPLCLNSHSRFVKRLSESKRNSFSAHQYLPEYSRLKSQHPPPTLITLSTLSDPQSPLCFFRSTLPFDRVRSL